MRGVPQTLAPGTQPEGVPEKQKPARNIGRAGQAALIDVSTPTAHIHGPSLPQAAHMRCTRPCPLHRNPPAPGRLTTDGKITHPCDSGGCFSLKEQRVPPHMSSPGRVPANAMGNEEHTYQALLYPNKSPYTVRRTHAPERQVKLQCFRC